jgi:hypothetical protein
VAAVQEVPVQSRTSGRPACRLPASRMLPVMFMRAVLKVGGKDDEEAPESTFQKIRWISCKSWIPREDFPIGDRR